MCYNSRYESIMLVNDQGIQVPLDDCISGHHEDCTNKLVCCSDDIEFRIIMSNTMDELSNQE